MGIEIDSLHYLNEVSEATREAIGEGKVAPKRRWLGKSNGSSEVVILLLRSEKLREETVQIVCNVSP